MLTKWMERKKIVASREKNLLKQLKTSLIRQYFYVQFFYVKVAKLYNTE